MPPGPFWLLRRPGSGRGRHLRDRFVVDQTGPAALSALRYIVGFCCLLPPALLGGGFGSSAAACCPSRYSASRSSAPWWLFATMPSFTSRPQPALWLAQHYPKVISGSRLIR